MTRNIVITGANGNLGSASIRKFLALDYHVIAVDHSGSRLGFTEGHSNFELHEVDLDNEEATTSFFNELISLKGRVDAALLLVGGYQQGNIETTTVQDLRKMLVLNFETAFNSAKPLFNHMMQNGSGRIVLVGAKPALDPKAGKDALAYALTKSLLFKLAEQLNVEAATAGKDVKVEIIAPGALDTPQNRKNMPDMDPAKFTKTELIADEFVSLVSIKQ